MVLLLSSNRPSRHQLFGVIPGALLYLTEYSRRVGESQFSSGPRDLKEGCVLFGNGL